MAIVHTDPRILSVVAAIESGTVASITRVLTAHRSLAGAHVTGADGGQRTLLHIAVDAPGHRPNTAAVIAALVEAGVEVDAPYIGAHSERPLHWAASNDDVTALDALVAAGADLEATGGVIGDGTALVDACAFGQWTTARRLLEHGARTTLWTAAALGLVDQVAPYFAGAAPDPADVTSALWGAAHGGQAATADYLIERGADLNAIGPEQLTPLDAATRGGHTELAASLRSRGAKTAAELA